MHNRARVLLVGLAWSMVACADNPASAVDAARRDLAQRLGVPLEQVSVRRNADPVVINEVAAGCVRQRVRVDAALEKVTGLVLVVKEQEHMYYASPGEPYRYCELPSTKKRGPPGPPIR